MKTIQMIIGGKWINLNGHGCKTDKDFINYVSLGPAIMRIADDSTHGATVYQEDILETQMLVAQNEIEEVPCKKCNGTGEMDTGGFTPWGAGITVTCDCVEGKRYE